MSKEVLVFSAVWCGNCGPWKEYLDSQGVEYTSVDVDSQEGMKLAQQHRVRGIPTTVILRDGVVVRNIVGAKPNELEVLVD